MKTLICDSPGHLSYQQQEMPNTEKGHALLKIKRIGICGTDLHAFEGTQPFFTYPRILGHELAAEIESIDNSSVFSKKELVTIIPYMHCGKCIACLQGLTNCCANINVCGVHVDGGMVEYFSIPSDYLVHGDGLTYDQLALVEPLAIGCHGVRRAAVTEGEHVLVVGAGPIGLGLAEFTRIAGGQITVMDITQKRLDFCQKSLSIKNVINPGDPHVREKMLEITDGDMYPVVIDATGNQKAINKSFEYLAHGGRYVLVGLQKGEVSFSHPEFHKRESTLMSSRNATREDFEYVVSCLKQKTIDPTVLITHRVQFDQVANQFEEWLNPNSGVIKAMVELQDK